MDPYLKEIVRQQLCGVEEDIDLDSYLESDQCKESDNTDTEEKVEEALEEEPTTPEYFEAFAENWRLFYHTKDGISCRKHAPPKNVRTRSCNIFIRAREFSSSC